MIDFAQNILDILERFEQQATEPPLVGIDEDYCLVKRDDLKTIVEFCAELHERLTDPEEEGQ